MNASHAYVCLANDEAVAWAHVVPGSLDEMVFDAAQVKSGYAKSDALPAYCRQGQFPRDRWGERPKNRLLRAPDGASSELGLTSA